MSYIEKLTDKTRISYINKNYYMLGVLATEEDVYPSKGLSTKSVVTQRDMNGDILFYVKSLTTEPSLFFEIDFETELFVGVDKYSFDYLNGNIINDKYRYVDNNEKVKILKNNLENKILFKALS